MRQQGLSARIEEAVTVVLGDAFVWEDGAEMHANAYPAPMIVPTEEAA